MNQIPMRFYVNAYSATLDDAIKEYHVIAERQPDLKTELWDISVTRQGQRFVIITLGTVKGRRPIIYFGKRILP